MSVREYLADRRMEQALSSILKGEKVEAIALEVGYKSKKTFYRHFRQRFGTTPSVYRGLTSESAATATDGTSAVPSS
jgi:AraC-like DNA-binding protein